MKIGVGLLPGGGGCLNLWKKMTANIPDAVTEVDLAKFFIPTFMAIAMAKSLHVGRRSPRQRFSSVPRIGSYSIVITSSVKLKKRFSKCSMKGYAPPVKRPIKVFGEAAQGMIAAELFNMQSAKFVSEYDVFLAKRIAFVISGGDVTPQQRRGTKM